MSAADPDLLSASERRPLRWGWLLITLVVLVVYWPLSTFGWSVSAHDTLNCWLPWRWAMASFLQDGHLPLWNPYQQFGYPQYADLQGPAWYVEALALGGTIGQGIHVLQGLFLVYLVIGGVGMMRLLRSVHGDPWAALTIGTAYALGGFFTGHQMHFYAVISAAWLPWAFDAVLRLLRAPSLRVALEAAVVHYLLLSGGNPTFTIIGAYVEVALGAAFLLRAWRTGGWPAARRLLTMAGVFIGSTAVLACGTLHALLEVFPLMSRGGGLDQEMAASSPFSFAALRSLFFPFTLGDDTARLGTDVPMANGFMGILVLALGVLGLFRARRLEENVLLVMGIIAGLAAFGSALPVHGWLWRHVPGMDLFRFPSYFRWFTWLAVLVLAGGTLRAWWTGAMDRRKVAIACWSAAAVGVVVALSLQPYGTSGSEAADWYWRITGLSSEERTGLAVPVPLIVLALAGLLAWRGTSPGWVLALVIMEMGWSTTWAQWDTAVSPVPPSVYASRLAQLSPGPVWPEPDAMDDHVDDGRRLHYLMYNVHDYFGRPSRSGYNSFWLANAAQLQLDHAPLWDAMGRQPVAYLTDRVVDRATYGTLVVDPQRDSALVVMPPGAPAPADLQTHPGDRLSLIGFASDGFRFTTSVQAPLMLVLQQSHYPGWEVRIDDRPAQLLNVNIAAMGVRVPEGRHRVEFVFHRPVAGLLLAVSLLSLLGVLFFLAWSSTLRAPALVGTGLLAVTLGWSLFAHRPKSERVPEGMRMLLQELPREASLLVNTDRAEALDLPAGVAVVRAERSWETGPVAEATDTGRSLWWIDAGLRAPPEVRGWVKDRMRVAERRVRRGVEAVRLEPSDTPMPGRTWSFTGDEQALHGGSPYTPSIELRSDSLRPFRTRSLVVDLEAWSHHPTRAGVVIERKNGERVTDHRQLPIVVKGSPDGPGWVPGYGVVPMEELYHAGGVLRIYVWYTGADTLRVRNVRIRTVEEPMDRW